MKKILTTLFFLFVGLGAFLAVFYLGDKFLNLNLTGSFFEKILQEKKEEPKVIKPLEIVYKQSVYEIYEGFFSTIIKSNKEIKLTKTDRYKLILVSGSDDWKNYVLEITNLAIGKSTLEIEFEDEDGQKKVAKYDLTRKEFTLPFGDKQIDPWTDFKYEIAPESLTANITKNFRLVSDYEPTDLVDISVDLNLYANVSGIKINKAAGESLKIMLSALKNETGKNIVIASGYRSYANQVQTYTNWVKARGKSVADEISARPGFSEHQSGNTVDFFSEDSGFDFTENFDRTIAGKWLIENAWQYGFVQSLPKDSSQYTGYVFEAWHYRYIGIENAKNWKSSGKSFPEWNLEN